MLTRYDAVLVFPVSHIDDGLINLSTFTAKPGIRQKDTSNSHYDDLHTLPELYLI